MDTDPWEWTVDDLVAHTCRSSDFYSISGHASPSRDALSAFEAYIRSEAITGKGFLTNDNPKMLDYISRVEPSRQRALLDIIKFLRSRSSLYQQQYATTGVESLDIGNEHNSVQLHPTPESEDHRKRRRVSHLTTLPLSLVNERAGGFTNDGEHAELVLYNGGTYEDLGRRWEQNENPDDIAGDDEEEENGEGNVEELSEPDEGLDELEELEELDRIPNIYARTGRLSRDQVVDIINEMIDKFTQQSRPEDNEVDADKPPEHYENRLDLIANDILSLHHATVEGVRFQCRSLEGTVDLLEKAKWLANINEPAMADAISRSRNSADVDRQASVSHHRFVESIDSEMLVEREENDTFPVEVQHPNDTIPTESRGRFRSPSVVELSARCIRRTGPVRNADRPDLASLHTISLYDWATIEEKKDRKRIIQKIIQAMKAEDLENLRTRVDSFRMQNLFMECRNCIEMFIKSEDRLQGVLREDLTKIKSFTRLFLSWWLAGNYTKNMPGLSHLRELQKHFVEASPVLYEDLKIFYYWVRWNLSNIFSVEALRRETGQPQAEYIVIPDDD